MTVTGLTYTDTGKDCTSEAELKKYVIEQAGGICQICKDAPATEADHVWPRRLGGPDHVLNRQAVCSRCNKVKGDRVDMDAATPQQLAWGLQALLVRAGDVLVESWHFAFLLGQADEPCSSRAYELIRELMARVHSEALDIRDELAAVETLYAEGGQP